MEICRKEQCTGCGLCVNVCAQKAVTMHPNAQGFLHPCVDEERCVQCGACRKRCPQNTPIALREDGQYFAALAKNDALREKSSSGGVFSLLADKVLGSGGVVFGAAYDASWRVVHRAAEDKEGLSSLRGSKYVQSDVGLVYRDVKTALEHERCVLFSGTACQVAALKAFLGKDYAALLTVDVVCHGAPSPMIYREWLDAETAKHGPIADVQFRRKAPGWKSFCAEVTHQNGDQTQCMLREGYMRGFLDDLYLRESCYACPYAQKGRVADISLGDYWGYRETGPEHIEDDDRGVSLVIVNTEAGRRAFAAVKRQLAVASRSYEDAVRGNPVLSRPAKCPPLRNAFWKDHQTMSWEALCETYFPSVTDRQDPVRQCDREYYARPFVSRHRRHKIHVLKVKMMNKLKKR